MGDVTWLSVFLQFVMSEDAIANIGGNTLITLFRGTPYTYRL